MLPKLLSRTGVFIRPKAVSRPAPIKGSSGKNSLFITCVPVLCILKTVPTSVKNAMDDPAFAAFVTDLMLKEIAPAIPYQIPPDETRDFGLKVIDRFRNPYLQHQWLSITMQYTSKIKSRVIPVLLKHYEQHNTPPERIALGFAAYILFMRAQPTHPVNDDKAGYFTDLWQKYPAPEVATITLKDKSLWGADLSQLKGFEDSVRLFLDDLIATGPTATLAKLTTKAIL